MQTAASSPSTSAADAQAGDAEATAETRRRQSSGRNSAVHTIAALLTQALSHWLTKLGALVGILLVLYSAYSSITGDLKRHTERQISLLSQSFEARLEALDAKFEARFEALDAKFEARFEAMDAKFEARFDAIEERLDGQDAAIARLTDKVDAIQTDVSDLSERVAVLEAAILQDL